MNSVLERKVNSAVQAHIKMLQSIIDKMDGNSIRCKQYCIMLETVMLGFTHDHPSWNVTLCMVVLSIVFSIMDAGYFALSRYFRKQQESFVDGVDALSNYEEKIFHVVTPNGLERVFEMSKAIVSIYVWPFYLCGVVLSICLVINV